jgi:hypothetical protein
VKDQKLNLAFPLSEKRKKDESVDCALLLEKNHAHIYLKNYKNIFTFYLLLIIETYLLEKSMLIFRRQILPSEHQKIAPKPMLNNWVMGNVFYGKSYVSILTKQVRVHFVRLADKRNWSPWSVMC